MRRPYAAAARRERRSGTSGKPRRCCRRVDIAASCGVVEPGPGGQWAPCLPLLLWCGGRGRVALYVPDCRIFCGRWVCNFLLRGSGGELGSALGCCLLAPEGAVSDARSGGDAVTFFTWRATVSCTLSVWHFLWLIGFKKFSRYVRPCLVAKKFAIFFRFPVTSNL